MSCSRPVSAASVIVYPSPRPCAGGISGEHLVNNLAVVIDDILSPSMFPSVVPTALQASQGRLRFPRQCRRVISLCQFPEHLADLGSAEPFQDLERTGCLPFQG